MKKSHFVLIGLGGVLLIMVYLLFSLGVFGGKSNNTTDNTTPTTQITEPSESVESVTDPTTDEEKQPTQETTETTNPPAIDEEIKPVEKIEIEGLEDIVPTNDETISTIVSTKLPSTKINDWWMNKSYGYIKAELLDSNADELPEEEYQTIVSWDEFKNLKLDDMFALEGYVVVSINENEKTAQGQMLFFDTTKCDCETIEQAVKHGCWMFTNVYDNSEEEETKIIPEHLLGKHDAYGIDIVISEWGQPNEAYHKNIIELSEMIILNYRLEGATVQVVGIHPLTELIPKAIVMINVYGDNCTLETTDTVLEEMEKM